MTTKDATMVLTPRPDAGTQRVTHAQERHG